jgi:hypothetical protein
VVGVDAVDGAHEGFASLRVRLGPEVGLEGRRGREVVAIDARLLVAVAILVEFLREPTRGAEEERAARGPVARTRRAMGVTAACTVVAALAQGDLRTVMASQAWASKGLS